MKITIIKVAMFEGKGADALKPIFFEIMDALLPEDILADYIDDRKEILPDHIDSDIIALSFDTFSAKRAYQLAKRYKTSENLVVMGGFHPTVCPDEAANFCDVVLCGDAESVWPEFLEDVRMGYVSPLYDGRTKSAPMIPLYQSKRNPYKSKYLPLGLVQFSRGCRFSCDFCSVKTMYPGSVVQKSTDEIVREIQSVKEKFIFFIDDNLFFDEKSAKELFQAIRPLRKKWACQISMDIAKNEELLQLMKESGCICVLIGFESLNTENLTSMGKSANLQMIDYEKTIRTLNQYKFMIYATFVIGYDADDKNTADTILKFAMKYNFAVANFNPLIPLPGTPLYRRLLAEGRLLFPDGWWLDESYRYGDTAFTPAQMTPEELRDSCRDARYQFYSIKNILKRFLGAHLKLGVTKAWYYFIINIVSGIEIKRKQGALLGKETDETNINKA